MTDLLQEQHTGITPIAQPGCLLFGPTPRTCQQTKLSTCCVQEDDPLDAFMADLNNMDKQPEVPTAPVPDKKRKADVGLDEEADNVADFLEVHMLKGNTPRKLP